MKKTFVVIFSLLLLSCQKTENELPLLLNYIPKDISVIIKVNDLQDFKSSIRNNGFIKKLDGSVLKADLNDFLSPLEHLDTKKELLFCFSEVGAGNFEYTLISRKTADLFKLDSISDRKIESLPYEGGTIQKISLKDATAYSTELNEVVIFSSSRLIIENSIRQSKLKGREGDLTLSKVYETSGNDVSATIIIKNSGFSSLFGELFPDKDFDIIEDLATWSALDILAGQDEITFNGIALSGDQASTLLPLFDRNSPETNRTPFITPVNAKGFVSFTYSDWELLYQNINTYNNKVITKDKNKALFDASNEVGIIYHGDEKSVAVHYTNIEAARTELENERTKVDEYRQTPIYRFSNFKVLASVYAPLIKNSASNFYTILDDFLVFSDKSENLKVIIANYQSKSTLGNSPTYKEYTKDLNDASTILIAGINPEFRELLSQGIKKEYAKDLNALNTKEYPHFAMQLVSDNGFTHINGLIKKVKQQSLAGSISQLLNISLDADILTKAQFVTNHRSKQKEIVVQDVENNLYLISNKGKILWKKKLDSPIQGDIQQVDLYRNGRLQLAFVTDDQFQILDRNGNEVEPFPLKMDKKITQPLAVFDYDKNQNYRFVICQGSDIKMYDRLGSIVGGFTFTKTTGQISNTPKHIRENGKDYLVFTEDNGKLHILDRRGNTRVKVNETIDFSGNPVFLYNSTFTTTDNQGSLIQVDKSGKIAKQSLGLRNNHKIDATIKTLASISENILSIKNQKVELDFGFYTSPKIFYINDKIYVAITDTQAKKIYLYDSNALIIENFPVYGISAIDMADIDNDRKLEFVVQGDKNVILVYKIN
ncbi:ribonuclease HII [Leptobacterium flavescens]|uniref:Ribonuclease HII n=1 Tax=Leptobacterium flavescens TaxID=472055 RepID=A0A6P0UPT2_9FLAO|nr:ribonuclease HII [Leptobacterium flavescens]NER14967.1 ribonuclease HII [Leptobacterium flavescens]